MLKQWSHILLSSTMGESLGEPQLRCYGAAATDECRSSGQDVCGSDRASSGGRYACSQPLTKKEGRKNAPKIEQG